MKPSWLLKNVWRFVVDVCLRWYNEGVGDLAAGVTFWLLISLPAFILAMLALLGPIDSFLDFGFEAELRSEVNRFIDISFTDASGNIRRAIDSLFEQSNPGLFTVSLAFALWSISRGFGGLIRALEDIYGITNGRSWYHTRFVAVGLAISTIVAVLPMLAIDRSLLADISSYDLRQFARAGLLILVMVVWCAFVYFYGTAKRHRWRFDLPGAVVCVSLWLLLYFGFNSFVGLLAGSNQVRAAVGAGLVILTWVWLAAQAFLIGGAVNYLLGSRLGIQRKTRTWRLHERLSRPSADSVE